jgi:UPF0716 family protein affecting phage T7 exclusion
MMFRASAIALVHMSLGIGLSLICTDFIALVLILPLARQAVSPRRWLTLNACAYPTKTQLIPIMPSQETKPTSSAVNNSNSVNGQGNRTVNGEVQRDDNQDQSGSRDQPSTAAGSVMRTMSDAEKKELGLK